MRCCLLLLLLSACDIYPSWKGEFNAGPVDPASFPPAYLGLNGDKSRPGSGTFTEVAAYSLGEKIGYYPFPFSPTALPSVQPRTPIDPLALTIDGKPNEVLPTPPAYNFFNGHRCYTNGDLVFDERTNDIRYDEQSNIFTALPSATYSLTRSATWSYAPVVQEVPVNAGDIECQSLKSDKAVRETFGEQPASGRYFAWAMIDPGAAVYRVGQTINTANGLGGQRFGWYNKYLVAYIDGGEIPTYDDTNKDGKAVHRMSPQRLFYPRSNVIPPPRGPTGPTGGSGSPGGIGQGYDVIEFPRSDDLGYSPVCQVLTYDIGVPTLQSELPKDAETIITNYESTFRSASPPYIFCLQVEP